MTSTTTGTSKSATHGSAANTPPGTITGARFSPAADRNKHAILQALQSLLPPSGRALEIASGTGQHVAWFAGHLPQWHWQPTDATPEGFADITGHTAGLCNVQAPRVLDVLKTPWLDGATLRFDAIYCANMIHIAPWATTTALLQGAAQRLAPNGVLLTYGPYLEDGVPTSEGNLSFDASLRMQNPEWGLRKREAVAQEAAQAGFGLVQRIAMPANNVLLVWALRLPL